MSYGVIKCCMWERNKQLAMRFYELLDVFFFSSSSMMFLSLFYWSFTVPFILILIEWTSPVWHLHLTAISGHRGLLNRSQSSRQKCTLSLSFLFFFLCLPRFYVSLMFCHRWWKKFCSSTSETTCVYERESVCVCVDCSLTEAEYIWLFLFSWFTSLGH